jgi:hypothetical protein
VVVIQLFFVAVGYERNLNDCGDYLNGYCDNLDCDRGYGHDHGCGRYCKDSLSLQVQPLHDDDHHDLHGDEHLGDDYGYHARDHDHDRVKVPFRVAERDHPHPKRLPKRR